MNRAARLGLCLSLLFGISVKASPAYAGTAPDDSSGQENRRDIVFVPVFFYSPETKVAGGAGVIQSFRGKDTDASSRPSTIQSLLIYTQKNQIVSLVATELYWGEETYRFDGSIGYVKFPNTFYGIGPETSDSMDEDYTAETFLFEASLRKRVYSGLKLGMRYEFQHVAMLEAEAEGLLERRAVVGSRGGDASGVGLVTDWDTRDNLFYPSRGSYHHFSATSFGSGIGSDFTFNRFYLDLRKYVSMGKSSVLAMQGVGHFTSGDPPFELLAMLGGENLLRGYYGGRYRDKHAAVIQAEYRRQLTDRWGLTAFAAAGTVAPTLESFMLSTTKPAGGFGVRYMFSRSEKINIRLDFGFGENTSGVYINAGEAF